MNNKTAMQQLEITGCPPKRGDHPITRGGRALSNRPRGRTVTPKVKVRGASFIAIAAQRAAERRRGAMHSGGKAKK